MKNKLFIIGAIIFTAVLLLIVFGDFSNDTSQSASVKQFETIQDNILQTEPEVEIDSLNAVRKVEYIEFEAKIITELNLNELSSELDGKLDTLILNSEKTSVLLTLSNHRDDLTIFDYSKMVELDNQSAEKWEIITEEMGGHHVVILLTFASNENPKELTITDLPVGEVLLNF